MEIVATPPIGLSEAYILRGNSYYQPYIATQADLTKIRDYLGVTNGYVVKHLGSLREFGLIRPEPDLWEQMEKVAV